MRVEMASVNNLQRGSYELHAESIRDRACRLMFHPFAGCPASCF